MITLLVAAFVSIPQDKLPENIQRYMDRSKSQREMEIKSLTARIKDMTASAKRNRGNKRYADELKALRQTLDDISKPDYHYTPKINPFEIQLNDVGAFDVEVIKYRDGRDNLQVAMGQFKISQIIDAENMIVVFEAYKAETNSRLEEFRSDPIWVIGVSTAGMIDSKTASLPGVFEVFGTKQYATVSGSTKTVFKVRPLDVKPYLTKKK